MRILQKSMTLMEIIMVVVLIGILATIGIANYTKTIANARTKEAKSLLLLIKHAEEVVRVENNVYVTCANTTACNTNLRLNLPNPASPTWTYSVPTAVSNTCFCAEAVTSVSGLSTYRIRNDWEVANTSSCSC